MSSHAIIHNDEGRQAEAKTELIVSPNNPSSPSSITSSPATQSYAEPYSVPPTPTIDNAVDKANPRVFPSPTEQHPSIWHRILYPAGVTPKHRKYEHWLGRIGFGAKGLLYCFVGGMTCASAIRLGHELNGSPQGAFILIGDFPGGIGLQIVMLLALLCYIAWRWWECFTYQGADATWSPFKNFFTFRLSPFISGCVYVAYSYYLIEAMANHEKPTCYPECWRHSDLGKAGLVLFGVAFSIACLTQLLNVFTKKWHFEINWDRCNKFERYTMLGLGHAGFIGRSGLFLFVAILMFRALRGSVHQGGNTMANGINQFIGTGAGRVFMFIFGFFTILYGLFALLCTRYRHFPTPSPSGQPLVYRHGDPINNNSAHPASVVRGDSFA